MNEMTRIPPATRAALAVLAQGACQFPGCRTPVVVFLGNQDEVNVEIVHIRGMDPDGPRYDPETTAAQHDSLSNILLMCVPHRKTLDREPESHPIALLETWQRHPDGVDLRGLTEQRLDDLLRTAFDDAREQAAQSLLQFEKTDPEAATMVRRLLDDLHNDRIRYGADPRLAETLTRVSRHLDTLIEPPRREPRPARVNVGWQHPAPTPRAAGSS